MANRYEGERSGGRWQRDETGRYDQDWSDRDGRADFDDNGNGGWRGRGGYTEGGWRAGQDREFGGFAGGSMGYASNRDYRSMPGYDEYRRGVDRGEQDWGRHAPGYGMSRGMGNYGGANLGPWSNPGDGQGASSGYGWREGMGDFGAGRAGQGGMSHHDEDYHHWRSQQIGKLDKDYEAYRNERRQKFSEDFEKWRSSRPQTGRHDETDANDGPRAAGSQNTTGSGPSGSSRHK